MKAPPVIVDIMMHAPIHEVWSAITDKEKMKKWYFDISDFKAEESYEFQFTGGTEDKPYIHLCKITEVIPEKKLSYSWRFKGFPGNSLLTFELFPKGNTTQLKLVHEGLETFSYNPDFSIENFKSGWEAIIGSSLKSFLEPHS